MKKWRQMTISMRNLSVQCLRIILFQKAIWPAKYVEFRRMKKWRKLISIETYKVLRLDLKNIHQETCLRYWLVFQLRAFYLQKAFQTHREGPERLLPQK